MKETSKAMRRRYLEDERGIFPWKHVIAGRGVDVGAGNDKVPLDSFIGFDTKDGDANHLSRYFPKESFDCLHGSHVLEHMHDAKAALRDWLTLVKPGGYVVQTVPDVGAYENFTYPSRWNPDHKSSFSMIYRGSKFPVHHHIPTFLASFEDVATISVMRYVEVYFDWKKHPAVDQTWKEEDAVEVWNEFVIQKRPPA